jgi:hypothetical protein
MHALAAVWNLGLVFSWLMMVDRDVLLEGDAVGTATPCEDRQFSIF